MELRAKVMQTPPAGMVISIPLEKVLTQLARGAVKITFGELRLAAPGVFVNSGGEHDHKPVMLPLNEILTRLNPALLARRVTQKQVELTDEIGSPFGALGQGITISTTPVKPPAAPPTPPLRMPTPPLRMPAPPSRMVTPVASSACIRPTPPSVPRPRSGSPRRKIMVIMAMARRNPSPRLSPIAPPSADGTGGHFRAAGRAFRRLAGGTAT